MAFTLGLGYFPRLLRWSHDGISGRPSESVHSHMDGEVGPEALEPCPFGHCASNAIDLDVDVRAFVRRLLGQCRPAAVLRRVWSVVIDAIDGMSWRRARTHVLKELREISEPRLVDVDATASIVGIPRVGWIAAAFPHIEPRLVFGTARESVCRASGLDALSLYASTALRDALLQIRSGNNLRPATVASAHPCDSANSMSLRRGNESAESLPAEIYTSHDSVNYTGKTR